MSHLSEDLVAIRDSKGLTSQDLVTLTRIPAGVIREIEQGILFNQPESQRTYVRSFVRNYAKALKVSDKDIVRALDEYFSSDGYSGFLRVTYLGGESDEVDSPQVDMFKRVIVTSTLGETEEFSRPDPSRKHNQMTPAPPDLTDVNWSGIRASSLNIPVRFIVIGAGAVLIGFFLVSAIMTQGFGLFADDGESSLTTEIPITPAPVLALTDSPLALDDSLMVSSISVPLPETLDIVIYAAYEKLEPVRVQTDFSTDIYPYWIDQGTGMRFEFKDQISIRGAFPRFVILFKGHIIPEKESFLVGGNTITIRRSYLESQPMFRAAAPDSLPGLPMPKRIVERPIFKP